MKKYYLNWKLIKTKVYKEHCFFCYFCFYTMSSETTFVQHANFLAAAKAHINNPNSQSPFGIQSQQSRLRGNHHPATDQSPFQATGQSPFHAQPRARSSYVGIQKAKKASDDTDHQIPAGPVTAREVSDILNAMSDDHIDVFIGSVVSGISGNISAFGHAFLTIMYKKHANSCSYTDFVERTDVRAFFAAALSSGKIPDLLYSGLFGALARATHDGISMNATAKRTIHENTCKILKYITTGENVSNITSIIDRLMGIKISIVTDDGPIEVSIRQMNADAVKTQNPHLFH